MSNTRSTSAAWQLLGGGGGNFPQASRPANLFVRRNLAPVNLPNADGLLWDPAETNAECYEVEFLIVNQHNAAITCTVGIDLAGGGGLAAPEFWMRNEVVPYPGDSAWRGPFVLLGNSTVRGLCSTIASGGCIHWRIRRMW